MATFVPIIFRLDGSYLIPLRMSRLGSAFEEIEFVPRELLEWTIEDAKAYGGIVEPYINHGFH